jgi:hypothetical protein
MGATPVQSPEFEPWWELLDSRLATELCAHLHLFFYKVVTWMFCSTCRYRCTSPSIMARRFHLLESWEELLNLLCCVVISLFQSQFILQKIVVSNVVV